MKRIVFRLRWNKKDRQWQLLRGSQVVILRLMGGERKYVAESLARAHCRDLWQINSMLCQLVIHNKNGQIQKGDSGEATYGRDPKRSKG